MPRYQTFIPSASQRLSHRVGLSQFHASCLGERSQGFTNAGQQEQEGGVNECERSLTASQRANVT